MRFLLALLLTAPGASAFKCLVLAADSCQLPNERQPIFVGTVLEVRPPKLVSFIRDHLTPSEFARWEQHELRLSIDRWKTLLAPLTPPSALAELASLDDDHLDEFLETIAPAPEWQMFSARVRVDETLSGPAASERTLWWEGAGCGAWLETGLRALFFPSVEDDGRWFHRACSPTREITSDDDEELAWLREAKGGAWRTSLDGGIPDAVQVELRSASRSYLAQPDAQGRFRFPDLVPDDYQLLAWTSGAE